MAADEFHASAVLESYSLVLNTQFHAAEERIQTEIGSNMFMNVISSEIGLWYASFTDNDKILSDSLRRARLICSDARKEIDLNTGKNGNFLRRFAGNILLVEGHVHKSFILFRQEEYIQGGLTLRKAWKQLQIVEKIFEEFILSSFSSLPLLPESEVVQEEMELEKKMSMVDGVSTWELYCKFKRIDWGKLTPDEQLVYGHYISLFGVFILGCETVPPSWRFVAKLLGFSSGWVGYSMKLLGIAGKLTSLRTVWVNVGKHLFEGYYGNNLDLCIATLEKTLQNDCPTSAAWTMSLGYIHRLMGSIEKSNAAFENCHQFSGDIALWPVTITYELGFNSFLVGDWESCFENVSIYMEKSEMKAYKAYGCYMLGVCSFMRGKPESEITPHMKKVSLFARENLAYDRYALRRANQYLKRKGFHPFDREWLAAFNLLEAQNFEPCNKHLDRARDILNEPKNYPSRSMRTEHQALYLYVRGSVQKRMENFEEAEVTLNKCLALKNQIKEETFVIAFSYILLAEMRVENNPPNLKEATNLVTKAKGMSDFDFDNILSHRIKRVENMVLMRKKE